MKKVVCTIMMLTGLFLSIPVMVCSREEQKVAPPVAQPIVREGEFAVKLVFALGLSPTEDEVEAESSLARAARCFGKAGVNFRTEFPETSETNYVGQHETVREFLCVFHLSP